MSQGGRHTGRSGIFFYLCHVKRGGAVLCLTNDTSVKNCDRHVSVALVGAIKKGALVFALRGKGEGRCKGSVRGKDSESCTHVTQMDTPQTHTHTRTPTSYCTEGDKSGQLEVRAVTVMLVALCARPGGMFRQNLRSSS